MTIASILKTPQPFPKYRAFSMQTGGKIFSYLKKNTDQEYDAYIKISNDLNDTTCHQLEKLKAMMGNYAKKTGTVFSFEPGLNCDDLAISTSTAKQIKSALLTNISQEEEPELTRKIYQILCKLTYKKQIKEKL